MIIILDKTLHTKKKRSEKDEKNRYDDFAFHFI